jgi:hypothetical protein
MSYSLARDGVSVVRNGRFIPASLDNADYQDFLSWQAAGNTPAAFVSPQPTSDDVDRERDRRLMTFSFGGKVYDFDEISRNRIDKARGSALAAIIAGAEANELRWADANNDFGWIAADNSYNTMDAQTTLAFGNAAAAWEGLHIVAARNLKNLDPIPEGYADDQYWPSAG